MSIGLTGHYTAINERFEAGSLGIGGENIVVEGPALRLPEIEAGFTIRRPDGREIELLTPRPAAPCIEFTSYLIGSGFVLPRDQITDELAFLSQGTRGHIVDVGHLSAPVLIEVGDEVWLR